MDKVHGNQALLTGINQLVSMLKMAIRKSLWPLGYDIIRRQPPVIYGIPDEDCYQSLFSPWDSARLFPEFTEVKNLTVCSRYSAWAVAQLLRLTHDVDGDIIELGVYKGGMGLLMDHIRSSFSKPKPLRLFDTFAGMPQTDPVLDRHREGDFSDTSLTAVKNLFAASSGVHFHEGLVEDTLPISDLGKVSFIHVDLDIYSAIKFSVEYLWPKLQPGGVIIFDDYGFPTCPGARKAVDEFFTDLPVKPFLLPFGSCFVQKPVSCG
ncbi:TylF/MycF/NovP-related O-methyltransferase [Acidocella sp.]|uniref:TylF/MycF/NovP-related O-methyltransferase n=1 Tax=Acidocella sp. TaxID=50710 RepID=UPI003D02F39B